MWFEFSQATLFITGAVLITVSRPIERYIEQVRLARIVFMILSLLFAVALVVKSLRANKKQWACIFALLPGLTYVLCSCAFSFYGELGATD